MKLLSKLYYNRWSTVGWIATTITPTHIGLLALQFYIIGWIFGILSAILWGLWALGKKAPEVFWLQVVLGIWCVWGLYGVLASG